jgi:SAM-dependent methyltransferase
MNQSSTFDEYVEGYEAACGQGLRLSGESRDYFARKRAEHTSAHVPDPASLRVVVDFGCGLGHTVPYLASHFGNAQVVGVDTATKAIEAASARYGTERINFAPSLEALESGSVDLVYTNGVFHHIPPQDRRAVVSEIADRLAPGGLFALWENNPWNPGTRLVMRRIPFDRDAITLPIPETKGLLRSAGLEVLRARCYFYFPACLRLLRGLEPLLEWLPLGAQYCVLGRKPLSTSARF